MSNLPTQELKSRRDSILVFIGVMFLVIVAQLFNLQIVQGERYLLQSEENYMRITPIPAPRGNIFDVNHETLVTSRPSFSAFYWYLDSEKAAETLPRLCAILGMDPRQAEEKVAKHAGRYFEPVPIARDITPEQYTSIVEDAPNLPGVFIEAEPIRYYPGQELASSILGYVSEITASQLGDERWRNYTIGNIVGQQGLESYYEDYLRGKDGGYQVEVDYRGRPTGNVGAGIEPVPGNDLYLALKRDLQTAIEEAGKETLLQRPKARGVSAVVLDVKTGGVLAMVSLPGFDANRLVTGISQAELDELLETRQWRFSNLATTGLYPPGSTYKIVSAVAALAEGRLAQRTRSYPRWRPLQRA